MKLAARESSKGAIRMAEEQLSCDHAGKQESS